MSIFCDMGLHDWAYYDHSSQIDGRRSCRKCGKMQVKGCASPQDIGWFNVGVDEFNRLGKIHVTIPMPKISGRSSCITKPLPELDSYRIFDAKHSKNVLVVYGHKGNEYHTLIFRFTKDYTKYDFRVIECDDVGDVNMVVLDNGVCITIPKEGLLELFGNVPFVNDIKSINDPDISIDMKLCKDGVKARFIKDKSLYSITMK